MLATIISIFFVCVFIVSILKWYYVKYKYLDTGLYAKYSGERLYPFIGNVWNLIHYAPCDLLHIVTELSYKHGGSVILQIGYYCGIFTSDYKLIKHILTSTTITHKALPYKFVASWLGTGLLLSHGEKWRKRRKMITPAFHYKILETFFGVFHSASDTLVQVIGTKISRTSKPIEVNALVSLCTLDIICEAAMGIKVKAQTYKDSEYVKTIKEISKLFFERFLSPLSYNDFWYRFTNAKRREDKCIKYLRGHTNSIIKSRRKELVEKSKNEDLTDQQFETGVRNRCAFLDLLLQSTIDGCPLSDEDIRQEVDTFMFEGHDTTASAISFALFSIAQYPEIQAKIFEEQQMIFGENKERISTYNELNTMKYLEMMIKETLRLYPTVPAVGREVTEDFEFDGVKFKKGLQLIITLFALHKNPEQFPEPDKFIPERFGPGNEIESKPFAYLPFSAGHRNCIGQKFSMLEMKATISKIIRHFELVAVEPEHKPQIVPEVILKSMNGLLIHFKHR